MSLKYFPSVTPSAIALGTAFTHGTSLVLSAPFFGSAYERAKASDTPEEFLKSKEGAGALAAWGSSLVGAAAKTYAVAAILQSTGTLTQKGAAYLGLLIFAIGTVPGAFVNIFQEKRPGEYVLVKVASDLLDSVGLAALLNWWGTRPDLV
ncbi:uncharacterized protein V2V93DRAFT_348332 [Kockiozyma suomiensis]|uniref:uncharacterized protein n=1 Tax=Kockiozyma suomiensis TaxID=1337062 RepID=UPI0033436DCA